MASRLNLVCVDDSPFSENGFDWYLNNCHRKEDTIGVLHVQRLPALPSIVRISAVPMTDEYNKNINETIVEAKKIEEKFKRICKQKELKCRFFTGHPNHSPGHGICELAKEQNASTIVMGQRGLGTVSRALLGSTSDYVLHHSTIPVLVVPPPNQS